MLRVLFACVLVTVCSGGSSVLPGFNELKKIGSFLRNKPEFLRQIEQEVLGDPSKSGDKNYRFCKGLECPKYNLVSKGKGFEHRCYNQTHWVETKSSMSHPKSFKGIEECMKSILQHFKGDNNKQHRCPRGFGKMFRKLYNYIRGANERQKIAITASVLTVMSNEDNVKVNFQMNFFVPPAQVATLPQPTDKQVKIVTLPARCLFVRSYGGRQTSLNRKMFKKEKRKLIRSLKKAGKKFVKSPLLFVEYNSPWNMFKRQKEVALIAKDSADGRMNISAIDNKRIAVSM